MEVNEQLIQAITKAVVEQLQRNGAQPARTPSRTGTQSLAGKTRMRPKHSYEHAVKAKQERTPRKLSLV